MINKRLRHCFSLALSLVIVLCMVFCVSAQEDYAARVDGIGYTTVAQAVENANGRVVTLLKDAEEYVTANSDLYLDLNGHTLAGLSMASGMLYGMDSTTDDYDCSNGYGKILSLTGSYAPNYKTDVTGTWRRYLAVEKSGAVSFHRIYLGIIKVNLRPGETGFGYKARFCGDEMATAQFDSFGVKLNLEGCSTVATQGQAAAELDITKEYSILLRGFDAANFGDTPVNAGAYVKLLDGSVISSTTYSTTLKTVVEQVNDTYTNYTQQQLSAVSAWIKATPNMLQWRTGNILYSGPEICMGNVSANAGQTVEVPVTISGNPGIAGAKITVSYPEELTLTNAVSGEAFSYLQYTMPGRFTSPCNFTWDSESGEATDDGVILTLTFTVAADVQIGECFEIGCTYKTGDIYDEDLNDVDLKIRGGSVTVGQQDSGAYTVIFVDYDGTVLKTQTVSEGASATAPAVLNRPGYLFTGWDRAFDNVAGDLVVTAQYRQLTGATIMVSNVIAQPGQSVEVPVIIANNPGIAGAKITVAYPTETVLTGAVNGEAFAGLQFATSGKFTSPCNFTWDSESGMVTGDGVIMVMTFEVPADAVEGQVFELTCSYRLGDIYDDNLDDVEFTVISGSITVG